MKAILIIFIFILTFCSSCSSSDDELDSHLNQIGIKLNDQYEVLKNESSFAIGDYLAEYTFKVSKNDYTKIIQIIKNTKGFQTVQTNEAPTHNFINSNLNIAKTAWERNGMFAYEIIIQDTIGSGYDGYILYLNKDRTVDFSYNEE